MRTEEQKAKSRAYYLANRERIIAYQKDYYRKNADAVRAYNRKRDADLGRAVSRRKLRQQREKAQSPPAALHPLSQIVMKVLREQRRLYQKITGVPHHLDHIVPLSCGGEHACWNLRPVTAEENLSRARR